MNTSGDESIGPAAIKLTRIGKRYEMPAGAPEQWVLRDLSLELQPKESLAVIGPSGSGKSTLLNLIGTLDRPDAGTVELMGRPVSGLPDAALAGLRAREIGFVFQLHHLLPQCTVLENVLLPTLPRTAGLAPGEAHARAIDLLERVGLTARMHHRPGQLSGGERQRAAVVRALINNPAIVLADEPTGSLDRHAADELADVLVALNRECGTTLVVVTHSPALARYMGRTATLADGKLEC